MQFARRIIQEHIIINRQWWCSKVGTASTKLFCCEQYKMYLETERKKRVASSRTHLQSVFFVRTPYSSFDVLQRKKKMYNQQQRVRGKKPVPSERQRKKAHIAILLQQQRTEQNIIGKKRKIKLYMKYKQQ